jgi:hypothetical protein
MIYLHYSGYSIHNKIPFSVSGENLIILAQNVAIVWLLWRYNKDITKTEKVILSFAFVFYAFLLLSDKFLSDHHWAIIAKSNIILRKFY